jgi:hypothetical protein
VEAWSDCFPEYIHESSIDSVACGYKGWISVHRSQLPALQSELYSVEGKNKPRVARRRVLAFPSLDSMHGYNTEVTISITASVSIFESNLDISIAIYCTT